MKKISVLDRILLLITGLLAAYQISFGLNGLNSLSTWSYTVGFGVLLVAGLLLIIMGFEGLNNQSVVIVSALIPLSLSLGLISEHASRFTWVYSIFAIAGLIAIGITRYTSTGKFAALILSLVHGISGLIIVFLPILLSIQGLKPAGYSFVGIGGALIGTGGLLLAFLKVGRPLLSERLILTVLPMLLLLMTAAFVYGFSFS